jgi:hypothetical protein
MNSKWLVILCRWIAPSCLILVGMAVSCYAQETRRQKPEQNPQQNQYRDQTQDTSQQQQQQQSVTTFTGKVSQKDNRYFLEDPVHRNSYQLADIWEVKRFLGKKVRVAGVLDQDRNILHVKSITPVP